MKSTIEGFYPAERTHLEYECGIKMSDQSRTASFFSYPFSSLVSCMTLAEAGFHYDGHDDAVVCRQCGLKYSGWKKEDDPREIHLNKSPKCPFFKPSEPEASVDICGSVGLKSGVEKSEKLHGACGGPSDGPVETRTDDRASPCMDTKSSESPNVNNDDTTGGDVSGPNISVTGDNGDDRTYPQPEQVIDITIPNDSIQTEQTTDIVEPHIIESVELNSDDSVSTSSHDSTSLASSSDVSGSLETIKPKYPQFAILATRLSSFRKWPTSLQQQPEDLARAGLFYEGRNDYVRCFHCGGGLREWDPEDDPFYEHARWFPSCPFLRLTKGDKFIMGVQSGSIEPPTPQKEQKDESRIENSDEDLFQHPAVLSVMELGYSKSLLARAIVVYKKQHGADFSAEKLLPVVWEIEENDSNDTKSEAETDQSSPIENGKEHESGSESESKSQYTELERIYRKSIDELTEENRVLREQKICKVCLDEDASIVFLPCGHLVTCPMCASALRKCPVCRIYIRGTVKAIIS
ncbi:baculoviral IAP repeat-containing protein 7-like isoform X1 [Argopecten irradians]|uniref:baculoviral IAP repeat-containing protein 7-like isoform X1 n=1 Tax=Argopecten irradians TaxID=31199 RepID=UPI00371D0252